MNNNFFAMYNFFFSCLSFFSRVYIFFLVSNFFFSFFLFYFFWEYFSGKEQRPTCCELEKINRLHRGFHSKMPGPSSLVVSMEKRERSPGDEVDVFDSSHSGDSWLSLSLQKHRMIILCWDYNMGERVGQVW